MAFNKEQRLQLLEETKTLRPEDRALINDYLSRSGFHRDDFARRIGYSPVSMRCFLENTYFKISSNDLAIRAAARKFIAAHPIGPERTAAGKLYRTSNYQLLRRYFCESLDRGCAYYVEGDPGTQKSFIAQYLIAELNRAEVSKNGAGRSAHYVYCAQGMSPLRLLKRIAEACGSPVVNDSDRIVRNLRFDFGGRRAVLVLDEAQHLKISCLEALRELYDRPPHFGLLFLGSHAFGELFARNALQLEQWNSRFRAGKMLPGMSREEGEEVIRGELGEGARREIVDRLLKGATVPHLRSSGKKSYVSARRLFESIDGVKSGKKETVA